MNGGRAGSDREETRHSSIQASTLSQNRRHAASTDAHASRRRRESSTWGTYSTYNTNRRRQSRRTVRHRVRARDSGVVLVEISAALLAQSTPTKSPPALDQASRGASGDSYCAVPRRAALASFVALAARSGRPACACARSQTPRTYVRTGDVRRPSQAPFAQASQKEEKQ